MMRPPRLFAVLALVAATTGCAPILLAGMVGQSQTSDVQQFEIDLLKENQERRERGLPPLDWCSETYACLGRGRIADRACLERVKRFRDGDITALGTSVLCPPKKK
jgi:uncharacterized protein YkwD